MVELFVSLKVPDNVAISAFHAIKRMGYPIEKLERYDYYSFDVKNESAFKRKIKSVDTIINSNKHLFSFELSKNEGFQVLVTNTEKDEYLLTSLKEDFGFKDLKKAKKGTLWVLYVSDIKRVEEITKNLLMNEHYQQFKVVQ